MSIGGDILSRKTYDTINLLKHRLLPLVDQKERELLQGVIGVRGEFHVVHYEEALRRFSSNLILNMLIEHFMNGERVREIKASVGLAALAVFGVDHSDRGGGAEGHVELLLVRAHVQTCVVVHAVGVEETQVFDAFLLFLA